MRPRYLSLAFELESLRETIEGVRLLYDLGDEGRAATAGDAVQALRSASAVWASVGARLGLLQRAVRGELDPALLMHAENVKRSADDENDVLLRSDS